MDKSNGVVPEWHPPSHLSDPYVCRQHVSRVHWCRISRGRIVGSANQAVAWRLSDYANPRGENCHPGARRLGRDVRMSEKTVRRSLAFLHEAGWLTLVRHGNRHIGHSDVYCLTLPLPVAAEVGRWTDPEQPQWVERPRNAPACAEGGGGRPEPCPPIPEPRQRDDRAPQSLLIPDSPAAIPDMREPIPDTGVQSTGPTHQGLFSSSRDSITGARQVERAILDQVRELDPEADDYDEDLLTAIEDVIGMVGIDTAASVRGMAMSEVHPRVIIRKALAMECVEAS